MFSLDRWELIMLWLCILSRLFGISERVFPFFLPAPVFISSGLLLSACFHLCLSQRGSPQIPSDLWFSKSGGIRQLWEALATSRCGYSMFIEGFALGW